MRRFYLISYDISEDKRRTKVFKTLQDFGDRVQFSIFCCQLNKRELLELKERLKKCIHQKEDQILFIDAGPVSNANPHPEINYLGKIWTPEPRVQII